MNIAQAGFVVIAAGGIALAGAGSASATPEDDFLYDLNNSGIGGPSDQLLGLGRQACADMQNGVSKPDSITKISSASNLGAAGSGFLYDSAGLLLCP